METGNSKKRRKCGRNEGRCERKIKTRKRIREGECVEGISKDIKRNEDRKERSRRGESMELSTEKVKCKTRQVRCNRISRCKRNKRTYLLTYSITHSLYGA
jgi:hypothetical protein